MTEYKKIGSLDRARVDAVGVGRNSIAVASGQQITIISETDRSGFEHSERVIDLSLNERVVVLSSDQITAYTRDGASVWSRTSNSPHAVASLPDKPVAGVLEPDRLRMVNLETGQEVASIDRRRPGQPRDDQLISTTTGFVASTWSFLRCIDASGEELFDRDLNAAIRAVGCCENLLVVGLQNGQIKGLDAQTGEQRWETELPVRQIPPAGDGVLLLSTDDGIKSIGADGSIGSIETLPGGDVYASLDGSVVCSIRNGSIDIHVPSEELIDIDVLSESVGVGGTIDVSVTNLGDTPRDIILDAALEHADLLPDERQLKLKPRDPIRTDFPVDSVRTDGPTEFAIHIDGRRIVTHQIEVSDAAQSTVATEATLSPTEVSDSGVVLELSVTNTGNIPLGSVSVLETDEQGSDIEPGETWTGTLTKPYEPGRTITVGMEVIRGNRRTELAPTCRLPEQPSIELNQQRDAIHGKIDADKRVVWADELVIEVPGAERIRSPIHIEDGSLLVVLPIYETGVARIGLSRLGISERARMTEQGPLADFSNQTNRPEQSTQRRNTGTGSTDRSTTTESDEQGHEYGTQREQGIIGQDTPGETESESVGSKAHSEDTGVSIVRELTDDSTAIGQAIEERLVVQNGTAEVVEPTVIVGEKRLEPGAIDPGETWTAERRAAFFPGDDRLGNLPEAIVKTGGDVCDRIGPERIELTNQAVMIRGAIDASGNYEIELKNNAGSDRRLTGLKIDGESIEIESQALTAGKRSTVSGIADSPPNRSDRVVPATVFVTDADGPSTAIETLITTQAPARGEADGFEKRIGSSTQVAGDYGTVVLVFENIQDGVFSEVTLEATGEPINDMLYSQAHRETLSPGERVEHYVDLKTDAGSTQFEITASYKTDSGEERSEVFRVAGPAVETEEEWTEEHRSSWTLESVTGNAIDAVDVPDRLFAEFR